MPEAGPRPTARSLLALVLLVAAALAAQSWWAGRLRAAVGADVAALARPGDIHMLSSDVCPVCEQARRWFTAHAVPYSECSIERDSACRARFEALGAAGTPVLDVRGRPQLGFSPESLRAALQAPR